MSVLENATSPEYRCPIGQNQNLLLQSGLGVNIHQHPVSFSAEQVNSQHSVSFSRWKDIAQAFCLDGQAGADGGPGLLRKSGCNPRNGYGDSSNAR